MLVQNYFDRLEQALAMRHRTKGDLATHLGVALSTVSRWRSAVPRAETVHQMADWLGVDAKWLMTGEAKKKPERDEYFDPSKFGFLADKMVQSEEPVTFPNNLPAPSENKLEKMEERLLAMENQLRILTAAISSLLPSNPPPPQQQPPQP